MRLNSIVIPAEAGIHVAAERQKIRHSVPTWIPAFAGMTVLFGTTLVSAAGLPFLNMDDYTTDAAATIALTDAYPAGTPMEPVLKVLGQAIPALGCEKYSDQAYVCSGESFIRGGFVYKKSWTVRIRAAEGKLDAIEAVSTMQAIGDESQIQ